MCAVSLCLDWGWRSSHCPVLSFSSYGAVSVVGGEVRWGVLSSQCVGLYCGVCSIVAALCCAVVLCAEKRRVVCVMNSGVCCGGVLLFLFPPSLFVFAVTALLV